MVSLKNYNSGQQISYILYILVWSQALVAQKEKSVGECDEKEDASNEWKG